MASISLDGSPTPRKMKKESASSNFIVHDDDDVENHPAHRLNGGPKPSGKREIGLTFSEAALPLKTSRLGNQLPPPAALMASVQASLHSNPSSSLRRKTVTSNPVVMQKPGRPCGPAYPNPVLPVVPRQLATAPSPMKELLAKLSEQQGKLAQQKSELDAQNNLSDSHSSSRSASEQANTDPFAITPGTGSNQTGDVQLDASEILQLKKQLEMAQTKLARMDQELSQSRITKHTMQQALGSQFDPDYDHTRDLGPQATVSRVDNWVQQTEPALVPIKYEAGPSTQGVWNTATAFGQTGPGIIGQGMPMPSDAAWTLPPANGINDSRMGPPTNNNFFHAGPNSRQHQHPLHHDGVSTGGYFNEPSPADMPMRSSGQPSRPPSAFGNHLQPWSSFGNTGSASNQTGITPPVTPLSFQGMEGMGPMAPMHAAPHNMHPSGMHQPYVPRPIGTRLSPTAAEFNSHGDYNRPQPWHMQQNPSLEPPTSYMSTAEPMNYRRLLDRNMSCNWKYIVDKIVHSNDQQASIFLQQKLKVGTTEQKFEIVQAIIEQAYPLMINRFGNFLVQRCFEHGTPEQIIAIARAIRGNTLNLSMDAFGCHVVQKAFDCVPEEYKAIMVHELLRRIPETVIHRYACHVWQKLFELRWSDSPPQIMKYVNEALRGMWHEVALGETGSLVVQNIFENCLEEDKRPCINEVLASIDVVAHGQFGNWCIQHVCEHGAPPDRTRAIDHVLRYATEYSMDQFASKVVEKCLKIGDGDFLDRYLDRVCEARQDRPRMPLIDISGDQFGNYLIQYILSHADAQRREIVAAHIRKHMVSLRGSKYGSRVAMLCCNPAVATRPGPPAGLSMSGRGGYRGDGPYGAGRAYSGPYNNNNNNSNNYR